MREEIQEVIEGHMSISDLIEKVSEKESDPLKKTNIINELWNELNSINQVHKKNAEDKEKTA